MGAGDRIELRGLRLLGRCGAGDEERSRLQPLEMDLEVELDLAAAGEADRLADTVDYASVCDTAASVVSATPVALLERLAWLVAGAVLDGHPGAVEVTVTAHKLRPPVPHDLATAGVRLTRRR